VFIFANVIDEICMLRVASKMGVSLVWQRVYVQCILYLSFYFAFEDVAKIV